MLSSITTKQLIELRVISDFGREYLNRIAQKDAFFTIIYLFMPLLVPKMNSRIDFNKFREIGEI